MSETLGEFFFAHVRLGQALSVDLEFGECSHASDM